MDFAKSLQHAFHYSILAQLLTRKGIFEEKVIEILLSKSSVSEKRCKLSEYGYKTILEDGMEKVEEGLICESELFRSLDGII